MRGLSLAFLLAAGLSLVQGRTLRYTFDIAARNVTPDGFTRSAITINGQTPGPVLTGNKGDDFLVLVKNNLNDPSMRESLTIHWHGIAQHRTAYDDGPAQVTQCPIAPGHYYLYHVKPTNSQDGNQTGTYWYHSHLSTQYVDGLRGPIVIYDPDDPHKCLYDVDDESTIITLTDWYHTSAKKLAFDWIHNLTAEPVPDSNLLNGIGRLTNGSAVPRAVVNVVQGKRYRFRILNISAIVSFNFTIEGHELTVIEADGVSHEPYVVKSIGMGAAQRYSVILNATQPVRNYWIAYPSKFEVNAVPEVNPNYNGTEAFAILRYQGAPDADPTTPQITVSNVGVFQEYKLKPLRNPPPIGPNENRVFLNLSMAPFNVGNGSLNVPGGSNVWKINGIQFTPPTTPVLLEILSNGLNQTAELPKGVYILPGNSVIDVQLSGDDDHPFHLHGHTFQVIQSASGPRNEIDPPIRDTTVTGTGPPITLRFTTKNPGPWFFHCHKDWHLEAGLAAVFAEDPAGIKEQIHPPPEWKRLCDIYNSLPPSKQ